MIAAGAICLRWSQCRVGDDIVNRGRGGQHHDHADGVADPEIAGRGVNLIERKRSGDIQDRAIQGSGDRRAGGDHGQHGDHVLVGGRPRIEMEPVAQDDRDHEVAQRQHELAGDHHINAVLDIRYQDVGEDSAEKHDRRECRRFDQQQQAEPIVGTPQRDPRLTELS